MSKRFTGKDLVIHLRKTGYLARVEKTDEIPSGYAVVVKEKKLELYQDGKIREEFTVNESLMTELEYEHKCSDERYYVGDDVLRDTFVAVMDGSISPVLNKHNTDVKRFLFATYVRAQIVINNRK